MTEVTFRPYKEEAAIRQLRIAAWYKAVASASGLSSRELERMFAEPDRQETGKRTCIWEKYRRGEILPRSGFRSPGQPNVVERVERCYPGTARWINQPLWRLVGRAPMEMSELKSFYYSLPKIMQGIFIYQNTSHDEIFWRRGVSFFHSCDLLARFVSLEGLSAIFAITKEIETRQFPESYEICCRIALENTAKVFAKENQSDVARKLIAHLIQKFSKSKSNIYYEEDFYLPATLDEDLDREEMDRY